MIRNQPLPELFILLVILQSHFLYARLQKDFLSNLHQFCKWITYRLPFEPETHLVRSQHRKCVVPNANAFVL